MSSSLNIALYNSASPSDLASANDTDDVVIISSTNSATELSVNTPVQSALIESFPANLVIDPSSTFLASTPEEIKKCLTFFEDIRENLIKFTFDKKKLDVRKIDKQYLEHLEMLKLFIITTISDAQIFISCIKLLSNLANLKPDQGLVNKRLFWLKGKLSDHEICDPYLMDIRSILIRMPRYTASGFLNYVILDTKSLAILKKVQKRTESIKTSNLLHNDPNYLYKLCSSKAKGSPKILIQLSPDDAFNALMDAVDRTTTNSVFKSLSKETCTKDSIP